MSSGGFKASKYFESMEEVEEYLEQIRKSCTPEEYLAMKKVLGLADQEGEYREVEGIGKIDRSIADLVEELNVHGFQTLSSCSGLGKEHPVDAKPESGYLSFTKNSKAEQIEFVSKKLALPLWDGEVYLKPALTVTVQGENDKEIEKKWEMLRSELLDK